MLSRCFLDCSVGVRASVIGLSQISSFSLVDFLATRILIGERSEPEILLKMNILCANFLYKSAK